MIISRSRLQCFTFHGSKGWNSYTGTTVNNHTIMSGPRRHASLTKDEETNAAAWEAARGAGWGATKWGLFSAVAGGVGYAFSPIYRGLTIQFKIYIQMSGMILGSMIEADKRMIAYEHHVRHQKRLRRDMEVWRRYEEDFEKRGTPGVGAESNVKGKGADV